MSSPEAAWGAPECPYQIEFAAGKLEEVRLAVTEAFYALPRGGIEIGGVLIGSREGSRIRIADYRTLPCEHLSGPSFSLSDKDKDQLREMVNGLGTAVAGWFHSHHRSEIFLSPEDIEIHRRFFPEPWHIAMVLRPENMKPMRAGYFVPDPHGELTGDRCAHEFAVKPNPAEMAAPRAASVPAPQPAAPRPTFIRKTVVDADAPIPKPPPLPAPPPAAPPRLEPVADLHPPERTLRVPFEETLSEPKRGRGVMWIGGAIAAAVLAGAAFATREVWMPKAPPVQPANVKATEAASPLLPPPAAAEPDKAAVPRKAEHKNKPVWRGRRARRRPVRKGP